MIFIFHAPRQVAESLEQSLGDIRIPDCAQIYGGSLARPFDKGESDSSAFLF